MRYVLTFVICGLLSLAHAAAEEKSLGFGITHTLSNYRTGAQVTLRGGIHGHGQTFTIQNGTSGREKSLLRRDVGWLRWLGQVASMGRATLD